MTAAPATVPEIFLMIPSTAGLRFNKQKVILYEAS
jgi:hypothetical protein